MVEVGNLVGWLCIMVSLILCLEVLAMRVFNLDGNEGAICMLQSTSKGNQTKWYLDGFYIKEDSLGYESIAEATVSELLHYVRGIDFVDYNLCTIVYGGEKHYGCYSRDFLKSGENVRTFYKLLEMYGFRWSDVKHCTGTDRYNYICDKLNSITGLDIQGYLTRVLALDYIVHNEDRHFNNLAVIECSDGTYREAPIFDNGLSLLSDIRDYPMYDSVSKCLRKVKAKPFNVNFKKQFLYTNGTPLSIDIVGFLDALDISCVGFKENQFNRAVYVLKTLLKETEGLAWIRV